MFTLYHITKNGYKGILLLQLYIAYMNKILESYN